MSTRRLTRNKVLGYLLMAFCLYVLLVNAYRSPYRVEVLKMCPVTGSVEGTVTWWGMKRSTSHEPTALEVWLKEREPDFVPRYERWCSFSRSFSGIRRSCVSPPPVHRLLDVQDEVVKLSTSELEDLVASLRNEDRSQHREVIEDVLAEVSAKSSLSEE